MRNLVAAIVVLVGATSVANVASSQTLIRLQKLTCQVVGSIPYTVTAPGRYCLSTDFTTDAQVAVQVSSSDVILDCYGHSLRELTPGASTIGIAISTGRKNVTVQNCNAINFDAGINTGQSFYLRLLNNRIEGAAYFGILASGDNANIVGNQVISTNSSIVDGIGILASTSSISRPMESLVVMNNVVAGVSSTNEAYGIKIEGATSPRITGNQVLDVSSVPGHGAHAIFLQAVSHATFASNAMMSRGTTAVQGLGTDGIPDATCVRNIAIGFADSGFDATCQKSVNDTELP